MQGGLRRVTSGTSLAPAAGVHQQQNGFTLLELLVTVAVLAVLAAVAIPAYNSYRIEMYDATAKCDLRNAMTAIESYATTNNGTLPPTEAALATAGHRLSRGVSFTRYTVTTKNGIPSVHMHVKHTKSPHSWHAHYPAEGSNIEIR